MSINKTNDKVALSKNTIEKIYDEIRDVYLKYPQPWVIGYSGGKDSTTVLQMVWKALESLKPEQRKKTVFVITADTLVEPPVIIDYINNTLEKLNIKAQETGMPFKALKVKPEQSNTFWVNLIGRGYPAPTIRFRWCTERLKIRPANHFIENTVTQFGEVIMVLGVRKAESSTRMQLMNTYQVKEHVLRRHSSLRGAYVYAPIADLSTDDVWTYLLQVPSPWGGSNRNLAALYKNASHSGECPLVIDTTTPPCGNSRFGCWVCTVAQTDSSMEALIENGEEWMEPLLEFRDWLSSTTDPDRKREFRDIIGRDGRVIFKKDGTLAARTYKFDISKQMLEKVLKAQELVRKNGPDPNMTLISKEELTEIRRIWKTERQDWEDSVPQISKNIATDNFEWPSDDNGQFDADNKHLLENICKEYDMPFALLAKLLEAELQSNGMARRANIQKQISSVLKREWRNENEIMANNSMFGNIEK